MAFLLSFSGSDLPVGSADNILTAPGPLSKDTHAAVGRQVTLRSAFPSSAENALLDAFLSMADSGKVGLVVKGRQAMRADMPIWVTGTSSPTAPPSA